MIDLYNFKQMIFVHTLIFGTTPNVSMCTNNTFRSFISMSRYDSNSTSNIRTSNLLYNLQTLT
jgi:hypothetical protein